MTGVAALRNNLEFSRTGVCTIDYRVQTLVYQENHPILLSHVVILIIQFSLRLPYMAKLVAVVKCS